jgi:hypothetical protein
MLDSWPVNQNSYPEAGKHMAVPPKHPSAHIGPFPAMPYGTAQCALWPAALPMRVLLPED